MERVRRSECRPAGSSRFSLLLLVLLQGCGSSAGPPAVDRAAVDRAGVSTADSSAWVPDRYQAADRAGSVADRRVELAADLPPPIKLQNVTQFVNLGDSLAAGYYASAGHSYASLLLQNDDVLYPAYVGKDLESRFPGVVLIDKSQPGSETAALVDQVAGLPPNPTGNTVVVVSSGGNDFKDNLLTTVLDPTGAAQKSAANLKKALAAFADKQRYPNQVYVVTLDVHDPTDGLGTIPFQAGLTGFCIALEFGGTVIGPGLVNCLATFNQILDAAALASGALLAENHNAFLGHGYHYNDPTLPQYSPSDPTLWFYTDCTHANDRGHHELRRLIWSKLTGE